MKLHFSKTAMEAFHAETTWSKGVLYEAADTTVTKGSWLRFACEDWLTLWAENKRLQGVLYEAAHMAEHEADRTLISQHCKSEADD